MAENRGTQSLTRALQLLEATSEIHDLEGLAEAVGISRSTAYRILSTLVDYRYVHHVPYSGYFLGPRLIQLGFKSYNELHLPSIARPFLEELAGATKETVHLAVLEGKQIVYIDKVLGSRQLQMASTIGMQASVQTTALGKCLISKLPQEQWPDFFDPSLLKTPNSIAGLDDFIQDIRKVAEQGYSFDLEENELGIRCVASPIMDGKNAVVAALSISSATVYMDESALKQSAARVKKTAQKISCELGWSGR